MRIDHKGSRCHVYLGLAMGDFRGQISSYILDGFR
jgi:hypothetical protein